MTPEIRSVGAVVVAARSVAQENRLHFSASAQRGGRRRRKKFFAVASLAAVVVAVAVQHGYSSRAQWQPGQCKTLSLLPPAALIKASSLVHLFTMRKCCLAYLQQ